VAKQPEREPLKRFEQPLIEGQAFAVQSDQAQGRTLVLPSGMNHEPIVEWRFLARGPAERSPKLLLAEGNRVIRDHKLSRMVRSVRQFVARDVPIHGVKKGSGKARQFSL
jgi:hypothetical protein